MISSSTIRVKAGYSWIVILLFACVSSLLTATPASAQNSVNCVADRGGIIDGFVNPVSPAQIEIDGNCTIRNFPPSNPLTSNISFYGNNPTSWLVIFDNVTFTGNMSCDKSQGNYIWFTNGSTSTIKPNCQNLFVPTEKIDKQNPPGQTTAAIGVPFTYKLTIPVLFDPVTGTVINTSGSPNELSYITVTDALNATGADLTLVSQRAYWRNGGAPIPYSFSNSGGTLTFTGFPVVPAGQQFIIEITAVLNNTQTNTPGKQFVNTAKWQFGRYIGGTFHPSLPGVWGISPPMTIVGPTLVMRKSGPATMNLGQWGNFSLDVQNTGTSDAWNAALRDLLPHVPNGGMCNLTPEIQSAQVFASDGVTPVPGKGLLVAGSDYSVSYNPSPSCQLNITMLSAASRIGPNERLIVRYRTQLDTNTQNGVTLTNIAGAIQWFNDNSNNPNRASYTRTLTNGTPGVLDHEDAFTVMASATGWFFEKTVMDVTSGANPATTAAPGDKLRYTLRFKTTGQALNNFSMFDDMDALNAQAAFAPSTLTLIATPAGADISATSSTGGTKGTGVIDVRNLNVPVNGEVVVQFDITLKSAVTNGTIVTNQATLRQANGATFAVSDDPNVNGQASPTVTGDEDPTRVTIVSADPTLVMRKSGPATLSPAQWGSFTLDVQNTATGDAWNVSLRDQLPTGATGGMCVTTPEIQGAQVFASDGVTPVAGKGVLNPGTDYSLSYAPAPNCRLDFVVLSAAGRIGPSERLIVHYRSQLDANTQNNVALTNIAGAIQWFNDNSNNPGRKTYTRNLTNGTPGVLDHEDAFTVTSALGGWFFEKTVTDITSGASPATTAAPGDKLRYTLRFKTTSQALNNFSMFDDMDALNAQAAFTPSTLTLVATPAGADISATSSTGGTKGTGVIDVRNLNVPVNGEVVVQFDITLKSALTNGVIVTNQATLRQANGATFAVSDDPNVNGQASSTVTGDEDPTRVTIVVGDPALVMRKSGPATMSLGQWGNFALDVQNTGTIDAWNAALRDQLPTGATGGMCVTTPEIQSAQVFASDGVTPVAGKPALNGGSDYSLNYAGAPNCRIDLTVLTAAGRIGPNERLIVHYRTQLDPNTQNNAALTNISGAIQWFNDNSNNPNRKTYTRALTNGTPGVLDHEDAFTVTASVSGWFFEKTVANLTSGANPTTTAAPGDKLRYTLRFKTTSQALNNFSMFDDMDALNAQAAFSPSTLTLVATPAGADVSATSNTGGTKGTGAIDVRNLNVPVNGEAIVQFDITLKSALTNSSIVTNQATLRQSNGATFAVSDDPNVNGQASSTVSGDEDATRVMIVSGDPVLVVRKSGPATMNQGVGQWGDFAIDVQNTGTNDAWNAALRDVLPHGATGGMCDLNPEILSAQVFASDGVTPVPGKGVLSSGADYSASYSPAPNCRLDITILTSAGRIGPNERLIVHYRTQLDANSQSGASLTNIAGAIQWFNADSSNPNRKSYSRTLTNGTPGVLDHEDAFTVTVALSGYLYEKTVANLTSGANPATTAAPGDKLRYTLRFRTNQGLTNFRIFDDLDSLNAQPYFAPGTLTLVTTPAGADTSATSSTGGTKGTGVIDVRNLSMPANQTTGNPTSCVNCPAPFVEVMIQFDITLKAAIANNTVVSNQGTLLLSNGSTFAISDDPNVNGAANPNVAGDEDPTRVTIVAADPVLVVRKSGPTTLNLGQWGNFAIDVQNTATGDAWNATLRDMLPHGATGGMCDLTPEILSAQVFASDGVTPVAGKGTLNAGSDYSLTYSGVPNCRFDFAVLTAAGRIGPNERLIIRYRTQLDINSQNAVPLTNVAGAIQWFNADSSNPNRTTSTRTLTNGTPGVLDHEDAFTVTTAISGYFFEKTVADLTSNANPATTAAPGDKLRYTLRFRTTNQPLSNFRIFDELDALNAQPEFTAGTLTLVTSPAGADTSATSSTGGAKGTGVIDVRNLSLPINSEAVIQFDITLKPAIANDTIVANQATLLTNGTPFAWSDDPNVNGTANPTVPNAQDPTRVKIVAAPVFRVQKVSSYLRDPSVLLAGDTLRYTITVKNISNADAANVTLRDATPVNTAYVAGSTKLNGVAVADVAGVSQLANGMVVNSPANPTPGAMPTDASSNGQSNIATITFDVVVDPKVVDGTAISNQGFVSSAGSGVVNQPSDDPRTPTPNDPTIDIVSNRPALYAEKHVVLFGDLGSPRVVDPGDVLRYTITIKNSATTAANGVILKDPIPPNTTYVANSTIFNGTSFGQPDNGLSPLASGININTIAAGATATLQYDLRVNAGTPAGTQISNQAVVTSTGQPNLLTDSDGNAANGYQPTVVVVGVAQQVSISNQVSVVGGGAAIPGAQLDYVINVMNTSTVPAYNVVITDDLNGSQAGQLTYVNQSATLDGSTAGVSFAGSTITANYNGQLAPAAVAVLKFRAILNSNIALGTLVTNTTVATWNNPPQTVTSSVSFNVGSVPGVPGGPGGPGGGVPVVATLNGAAWHDANFNDVRDAGEHVLAGWTVELYRDNQLSQSVQTDANGDYVIPNVQPNDTNGVRYELRFHAPGEVATTAMLGRGVSPFTNGLQRITNIVVRSGANLQDLNLAIQPNGVVYNSNKRSPIAGASLALLDARSNSPLPVACFDDAAQQGQITLIEGYYKFDINFSDPACPSGGDYLIGVTAPAGMNYAAGYSQTIPPASNVSTAAFSVPACPSSSADAIPSTAQYCEVQPSEFAPGASIAARSAGTTYYVHLMLNGIQMPGTSQIFNNHIPLDPQVVGALAVSKTTPLLNITRGQLVPYVITVSNLTAQPVTDVGIVDRLPQGFTYVKGSAVLDGVATEPSIVGRELNWNGLSVAGKQVRTVKLLAVAGAGVSEGEFVNRAQAMNFVTGGAMSGEATATVRLVPDLTFDCTDVTGKVFNDINRNGVQDEGEEGLAGVRVVTPQGLVATTDQFGRYHITCAITPQESRGSNFVLKLDERTLPSGFRMLTDQVQIQRATRGKALRVNFGASIHRVVGIDLSNDAFEPGKTDIRVQWKPRIQMLVDELRKGPAVLRLSYIADTEDESLVNRRVEAIKRQLTEAWDAADHSYTLAIEPEIFWRLGGPPKRPDVRVQGKR